MRCELGEFEDDECIEALLVDVSVPCRDILVEDVGLGTPLEILVTLDVNEITGERDEATLPVSVALFMEVDDMVRAAVNDVIEVSDNKGESVDDDEAV